MRWNSIVLRVKCYENDDFVDIVGTHVAIWALSQPALTAR